MIAFVKVFKESVRQAFQQLVSNKLRTFLSLLGITIGILCIIGVQSAVDSLEDNIRGSFDKLGDDVVYVDKWPWAGGPDFAWWEFVKRPYPDHSDYKVLTKKLRSAELTSFHVVLGRNTIKYRSSSVERVAAIGASFELQEMFKLEIANGRFFSPSEYYYGSNKIILGHEVAKELFGDKDPIGKRVKFRGKTVEIIGVVVKSGDSLVNILDFDNTAMVSYTFAKSMANLNSNQILDGTVAIKAKAGVNLEAVKDEATGILRGHHRLKPKAKDDFSLNELTMLSDALDGIFKILNIAGRIIGGFALIVGMFSVANIMFVSVKERTNIIGIKMAIGAKRAMILAEFLIESVILCILGCIVGLLMVALIVKLLSAALDFEMYLSMSNIGFGLIISVIVGVFSGIIPAFMASKMDPVEAIRQG
ncbi:MAG: ABC transporter permease [Bacteroidia bacterium]|nr:ABC transporter permease [Bacteroidia bacterium]